MEHNVNRRIGTSKPDGYVDGQKDLEPQREKRVRVRRCRDDFRPTGPTLMQIGCCCCCCCLHMIGAVIGTAVGITGAFMREAHLEPERRASDAARRTIGVALAVGLLGSVAIWCGLYAAEKFFGGNGEGVFIFLVLAPGFAVLPMSLIVIIVGIFADQTNDCWVPATNDEPPHPLSGIRVVGDELAESSAPSANSQMNAGALVSVKNWGGLRLAIRAAWMILAVATLLSGLGYALMITIMD
ncbi:MAG: hypothetical protein ACI9G1_003478 [Pirellulaceae bacterium]|jgi:hypothetical protein